jgi:hypothetical protein
VSVALFAGHATYVGVRSKLSHSPVQKPVEIEHKDFISARGGKVVFAFEVAKLLSAAALTAFSTIALLATHGNTLRHLSIILTSVSGCSRSTANRTLTHLDSFSFIAHCIGIHHLPHPHVTPRPTLTQALALLTCDISGLLHLRRLYVP